MKLPLTLAFSYLWTLDTVLTLQFVEQGGTEMEANPLLRSLMENYGMGTFIAVKLLLLLVWILLHKRVHWGIHAALNAIMIPVVCMGYIVAGFSW